MMSPWTKIKVINKNKNKASKSKRNARLASEMAKMLLQFTPVAAQSSAIVNNARKGVNAAAKVVRAVKKAKSQKDKATKEASILSKAGREFLRCICKPFDPYLVLGGLAPAAMPSYKARAYASGRFTTNTTSGIGFVVVSPCTASNYPAIFYTNSTFTGTAVALPNSNSANGVVPMNFPSGMNSSNLIDQDTIGVTGRIVAVALRCMFEGKELYRCGRVYSYTTSGHQSLIGADETYFGARQDCQSEAVLGGVEYETFAIPMDDDEASYMNYKQTTAVAEELYYTYSSETTTSYANASGTGSGTTSYITGTPVMGIFVSTNDTTNVQSFFWEAVQFTEYSGPGVAPCLLSKSECDYNAHVLLTNAFGDARSRSKNNRGWCANFESALRERGVQVRS